MHNHKKWLSFLWVILLISLQIGCRGAAARKSYRIGDSVQIEKNVTLTLQSWDVQVNDLLAHFSIQNKGTEKFVMHATFFILHQQKAVRDFPALAPVAQAGPSHECTSTLFGDILPGATMEGTVCWKDLGGYGLAYPLQMKYSLHMFDPFQRSTVFWTLQAYTTGEAVKLKDWVTITLDRIAVSNGGDDLQADFTVVNQSAGTYYFDGAFQILPQQERSNGLAPSLATSSCGPALIGMIQPGQKATGNICWSGLADSSITFPLQIKYGFASETHEQVIWVVNQ